MAEYQDKKFGVSFVVSCKDMRCDAEPDACSACLHSIVGQSVKKFDGFKSSMITTANGSRQFGVSFVATCRKPDCSIDVPRAVACCTANADKCEMCLTTIVGRSVREMHGFHVKEIVVV